MFLLVSYRTVCSFSGSLGSVLRRCFLSFGTRRVTLLCTSMVDAFHAAVADGAAAGTDNRTLCCDNRIVRQSATNVVAVGASFLRSSCRDNRMVLATP